jgi:hypothetical protein
MKFIYDDGGRAAAGFQDLLLGESQKRKRASEIR